MESSYPPNREWLPNELAPKGHTNWALVCPSRAHLANLVCQSHANLIMPINFLQEDVRVQDASCQRRKLIVQLNAPRTSGCSCLRRFWAARCWPILLPVAITWKRVRRAHSEHGTLTTDCIKRPAHIEVKAGLTFSVRLAAHPSTLWACRAY